MSALDPAPRAGAGREVVVVRGPTTFARRGIRHPISLIAASADASITSFERAVIHAPVQIGPGIDLSSCRFDGAIGLEHLRFSEAAFERRARRYVTADDSEYVYRQLRRAAHASGLHQLGADFHIGELEARRRSASWPVAAALQVYRFAGGWGHRVGRPVMTWLVMIYAVSLLIITWPRRFLGEGFTFGGAYIDVRNHQSIYIKYVGRNALAFFSELDYGDVHNDGYALLLLTKIASTVLLVFVVMAARSRLRR